MGFKQVLLKDRIDKKKRGGALWTQTLTNTTIVILRLTITLDKQKIHNLNLIIVQIRKSALGEINSSIIKKNTREVKSQKLQLNE